MPQILLKVAYPLPSIFGIAAANLVPVPDFALPALRAQAFYQTLAEPLLALRLANVARAVAARQVLERVLEEATEPFAYRVDFDGAYSRLVFVQQEFALAKSVVNRVHVARRHLNQLIHGKIDEQSFDVGLAFGSIARLVEILSGQEPPSPLAGLVPASKKYSQAAQKREAETLAWVRFLVTGWHEKEIAGHPALILEGFAQEGYPDPEAKLNVVLTRHPDPKNPTQALQDFTYLSALLWPFVRLNLAQFREREDAPGVLYSQVHSQVILDPDFLVEASDLAGCFTQKGMQPLAYLLHKLMPQPPKASLFKGTIVNDLLDSILENHQTPFKDLFGHIVQHNFIKTASLGRKAVAEIYQTIKADHLENLIAFSEHYQGKPLATEPSYISPRFGIAGRMDVVIHDPDQEPTRWEVIELKSGKPPRQGVWAEHQVQALVYNLLLESVATEQGLPGRTGATEVFYSLADTKGRVVPDSHALRHSILEARNYIVAIQRQLRRGNWAALDVLAEQEIKLADQIPMEREGLRAFAQAWSAASPEAKSYYGTWLGFLLREFAAAKTGEALANATLRDASVGGYAGLWRDSIIKKRSRFEALEPLTFLELEPNGRVHFAYTPPEDAHCSLRLGDIVALYPFTPVPGNWDDDAPRLQPGAHPLAKGSLVSMKPGKVVVQLRSRILSPGYFYRHPIWIAEPDHMDASHWHSVSSLFHFLQADQHRPGLQDLLLGVRGPAMPDSKPLPFSASCKLLISQRSVVEAAVQAQDYFLLQGPPGTGKTSATLPEIIKQELARGRRNITILCYTNRALDEVQTQLERLHSEESISYLSLKKKARTDDELASLLQGQPFKLETVAEAVGAIRVFLCTISSFLSNVYYLQQLCGSLDLLVVDEASMATEAQIVGLLPFFSKFILIGDENQLPPVVVQAEAFCQVESISPLKTLGFEDLRHSLFERLLARCKKAGWHHAYGILTDHFRMHPLLADLVNPYYVNRLHAAGPAKEELVAYWESELPLASILGMGRSLFIETGASPAPKHHIEEARLAARLAQSVRALIPHFSIGIISPWRAQNRQLLLELQVLGLPTADEEHSSIKVDTIERFQGAERDVMIYSTALTEARYLRAMQSVISREGLPAPYADVDRKMVVALSRARQQVILLGHAPFLSPDIHYGTLLEVIKRRGSFITRQVLERALSEVA